MGVCSNQQPLTKATQYGESVSAYPFINVLSVNRLSYSALAALEHWPKALRLHPNRILRERLFHEKPFFVVILIF